LEKLGRDAPRERRAVSPFFAWPVLRDARKRAPQDEVFTHDTQSNPHGEEARQRRLEPCRPGSLTRHAPRRRGIQHAAASRSSTAVSGILDCMVCAYPEGWGAGGPWITGWVP